MTDIAHNFGNDLAIGPTGDLAVATGNFEVQQRILRALVFRYVPAHKNRPNDLTLLAQQRTKAIVAKPGFSAVLAPQLELLPGR